MVRYHTYSVSHAMHAMHAIPVKSVPYSIYVGRYVGRYLVGVGMYDATYL